MKAELRGLDFILYVAGAPLDLSHGQLISKEEEKRQGGVFAMVLVSDDEV